MSLRLDEILANGDDSQLIGYQFENRILCLQLFLRRMGVLVSFEAPTDTVYARSVPTSESRARCQILLAKLDRLLMVREGRYIPASDPSRALHQSLSHLNLAYGRRPEDAGWIFTLQGEYTLLSFLLRDLNELQWTVE